MVSFYVRAPGDWDIEFGTEGMRVDETYYTAEEITADSYWGHEWVSRPSGGDAAMTPPTRDVIPVPRVVDQRWDHEADVVIAGYGIAGAAAAVEAARGGADVLVLERTGSWGGAAAMAGGFIYLGGGTAAPKGLRLRRFRRQHGGLPQRRRWAPVPTNVASPTTARAASRISTGWSDCGVPFKPEFLGEPGWEPLGDQGSDVQRRGKLLPVQHDRRPGAARPRPADVG